MGMDMGMDMDMHMDMLLPVIEGLEPLVVHDELGVRDSVGAIDVSTAKLLLADLLIRKSVSR